MAKQVSREIEDKCRLDIQGGMVLLAREIVAPKNHNRYVARDGFEQIKRSL